MVTKTLTIMEDAYELLKQNKLEGESFSEEIRRIITKKKRRPLMDFFGILNEKEGDALMCHLQERREKQIQFHKERIKRWKS
jgi:predicted CopG family antitoxin